MRRILAVTAVAAIVCAPAVARAQDAPARPEEKQERPTGLPSALKWTFNFDAGWGTFGFGNSLYINPKDPGVNENLSDQWFEGFVKPALSGSYTLASGSEVYGKISGVGEGTYGAVPDLFGQDTSSFKVEDLSIGWRSGDSLSLGKDVVDVAIGRTQYKLGHGLLVYDGASEGGSRGGYWINARQAFEFAAVARFKPGPHTIETFYLDKDELPESDSGTRLWGVNYEFSAVKDATTTVGATYMHFGADAGMKPERDGLNVFNVRAYTAPVVSVPGLTFEAEYASERNGEALSADAYTFQGAYQFNDYEWTPKISYRYAFFQGDDPATAANESFDPLLPSFYDWGTWWQGEIAGEYFLSNSNLTSHQVRVHVTPNESLSGGLMYFSFRADHPETYGPGVTSTNIAIELDAYADWKVNSNFTVSLVGAYGDPGKAVQQLTGRTKNFAYGMAYVAYSF